MRDVTVVERGAFERIFRDRLPHIAPELVTVVYSNLSEKGSRVASAEVTADVTKAHLENAGFALPEISLETVFKSLEKGE